MNPLRRSSPSEGRSIRATYSAMIGAGGRRIGRRIGAIIGITMALFGVVGVLFVLSQTSRTQEETENRLARIVADTIAVSFMTFDPRSGQHPIGDITAELAEREDLKNLEVFDDRGR